jgi:hypothetical protein
VALSGDITRLTAVTEVTVDSIPVHSALASYTSDVTGCYNDLGCETAVNRKLASTLSTFAGQLRTISMPSRATAANAKLITATSGMAATFARLGAVTTQDQYDSIAQSSGAVQAVDQFDTAYDNLLSALNADAFHP